MEVKVEKTDANEVKIEIRVPAERFKKGIDKAYRKNVTKFNVPGFRKGKAPKEIIEKMYGEEVFYEDAVDFIIDETYPEVLKDNNIEPVDRPEVDVTEIGKDKEFVYTAKVKVKPDAELGQYKDIEAKKPEYPITDEEVQNRLQQMREKNARIIDKESGIIENQDIAVIDYEGFIDGVPFEGGKGTNHQLEIGSQSFIEGFEEQLIGKNTGDETEITVKFPDDYRAVELAGKDATFKVKINEVKYKELSTLDDEFAKDVSEFDTLEQLKDDIRKKIKESNEERAKKEFEDIVVKTVVENAKVEIPSVMVDREIDYMMQELKYRLNYQGMTLEQYAGFINTTEEKMKEDYREVALAKVKTQLVLEKVGKVEAISVDEKEIDDEIEKMAKQYGQEADMLKSSIKDREKDIIKNDIITNKAIDLLIKNAKSIV